MSDQQIRSTARNTVMLLAGTLIRLVLTFGFIILAADQMEVAEFGIYCIGVHYFELFLSLAGTAIGILLTREIAKFPKHSSELTTSATVFAVLMAAFAAALLVILAFVLGFSKETQVVLLISTVALFPAAICLVFEAALVAFEKSETIALAAAIEVIIRIGLSVLVIVQGWGLNFLFVVLILSRLIQMLVLGCGVVFKLKMTLNWNFRRTIRFVRRWPTFAAENWMANLYTNLDVLLLSVLSTEVAVGLYSAAWKIIRLGMVFAKTYTTAVFPLLTRIQKKSRDQFSQLNLDTLRLMMAVSIPVVVFTAVVSDRIISLVYFSGKYVDAGPVLKVLAFVLVLEFINPFLSHTLFARNRQDKSMWVAGIALAVNSIATFVLVIQFAEVGAAIGTVIGGLVATLCYLAFAMSHKEMVQFAVAFARSCLVAICIFGIAILCRESSWPVLAFSSFAVFAASAIGFQVVVRQDAQLVLSLIRSKHLNS